MKENKVFGICSPYDMNMSVQNIWQKVHVWLDERIILKLNLNSIISVYGQDLEQIPLLISSE